MKNNKTKKNDLKEYLYKILFVDETESLIMIYTLDTKVQQLLSPEGKPLEQISYDIHYVNLTRSLMENSTILESYTIQDIQAFKENVEIVDPQECKDDILDVGSRITVEMSMLANKMQELTQAFSTFRYLLGSEQDIVNNQSAFVVSDGVSNLAQIVFKTVTGDIATLDKEDVERMGKTILDTIASHAEIDTKSKESVKKLSDELEYKLIEALPDRMKTEDVHINMDAILSEIKNFQDNNNQNEEDGDQ